MPQSTSLNKEIRLARQALQIAKRPEESVPEDAYDTRAEEVKLAKALVKVHEEWILDIIEALKDV